MDSFFARNRLSAYLDRTLPKAEAEAVAEAVARDMALSADLRAMKQALTLLETSGRVTVPMGFKARTLAVVAQQAVTGGQMAWLHRRLARVPNEWIAVVGAAVVVLAALTTQSFMQEPTPAEESTAVMPAPKKDADLIPVTPSTETPKPTEPTAKAPHPTAERSPDPPKVSAAKVTRDTPFDPSSPMGFRILHGGDQVLYDIATLADETGGRLVDVHGKLVTPHSLNEARSFTQLYLITPEKTAGRSRFSH